MPEGIAVFVDDSGYAEVEFLDPALKGPGLGRLLAVTPAEFVEKRTSGLRPRYRVPEGNVREAGLLDGAAGGGQAAAAEAVSAAPAAEVSVTGPNYDDGFPDSDWSRKAIDEFAARLDPPLDTRGERTKRDALAAIRRHLNQG